MSGAVHRHRPGIAPSANCGACFAPVASCVSTNTCCPTARRSQSAKGRSTESSGRARLAAATPLATHRPRSSTPASRSNTSAACGSILYRSPFRSARTPSAGRADADSPAPQRSTVRAGAARAGARRSVGYPRGVLTCAHEDGPCVNQWEPGSGASTSPPSDAQGRAARRGRLRRYQPARPERLASRFRRALLLQDLRVAHRRRLPARPPRPARQARATVALGRNERGRVRPAPVLPIRSRGGPLRRRQRQLPQPPRGRDRPAPPRPHRHPDDPHARRRARGLAARLAGALGHSDGSPAAVTSGPRKWEQPGGTIAFNFLHPDRSVVDERYVDRIASEHNISLRMGCSATLVRARSRSRSPARLCSAASSARG